MKILLDADASPVTSEISKISKKYNLELKIIKNYNVTLNVNYGEIITVEPTRDSADIYIINNANKRDLVLTRDMGLAAIALAKNAYVMDFMGNLLKDEDMDFQLQFRHEKLKFRKEQRVYSKFKKRTKLDDKIFTEKFESFLKCILYD